VSDPSAASDDRAADTPLKAKSLSPDYGRLLALRGLDLSVAAGECVALVGANGSGKSTAVGTIAGLLLPTFPSHSSTAALPELPRQQPSGPVVAIGALGCFIARDPPDE
jgi:ATPase subunit of ABC transporter with duplicated ATPase domains